MRKRDVFSGREQQQLQRRQINHQIKQQLANDLQSHTTHWHHQALKATERLHRL
jgi:hypothetical protein